MSLRGVVGINAGDPTRPTPFEGIAIPAFYDDALCAQVDMDSFFPEKGASVRVPKSVCARCEVSEKCLQWALDNDERHGIWGGKSERERRKIARVQRREPEPDAIRAWARRNGITCSATGAIPIAVREAFAADQEAA